MMPYNSCFKSISVLIIISKQYTLLEHEKGDFTFNTFDLSKRKL